MNKVMYPLLIFLFISHPGYTQDYIPLLDSNKYWNIVEGMSGFYGTSSKTYQYSVRKDTIINEKEYWSIYVRIDTTMEFDPAGGFLREDTITKKVFLFD